MFKKKSTIICLILATLTLTGCSVTSTFATTDVRTITLKNGGSVECVVAGASSGSPAIDCIEATYLPPVGE